MAGLRLLDGRHRVLAEFRRHPDAGLHGWPQGSFVHQPDLEAVLAPPRRPIRASSSSGESR